MDKTYFNSLWMDASQFPQFSQWVSNVEAQRKKAYCTVCRKEIDLSNMGRQSLISHMKGKIHVKQMALKKSQPSLIGLFGYKASNNPQTSSSAISSENIPVVEVSNLADKDQTSLLNYICKDDVTRSEIIWALHVIQSKASLNSCQQIGEVFKVMFHDSKISSSFQLGATKCSYVINHGLSPYFKEILIKKLSTCQDYVICFDEALNKVIQKGQMDAYVRYYDTKKNEVSSQYLGSTYLGHATANDLLKGFNILIEPLNKGNLLQVSMDGPNVNLSFLKKLQEERKDQCKDDKQLINIGVCGLHVLNGALKTGLQAAKWELKTFLRDCYYLFNNTPARRDDYKSITGSSKLPLKYCTTRWTENVKCIDRILEIFANINEYVDKAKLPCTDTANNVKKSIKDVYIRPKLAFFKMIAAIFEPFLRKFQGNEPLTPYLYSDLHDIVTNLMSFFIKPSKLIALTSNQLISIDILSATNIMDISNINVGFGAKKYLRREANCNQFKLDCRIFLQATTTKLLEKSPLKYKLVRGLTCLDPQIIRDHATVGVQRMEIVLERFHSDNRITDTFAEKAKLQYFSLTEKVQTTFINNFNSFHEQKDKVRLDKFYSEIMEGNQSFHELWTVIKMCLILSHGNASVESGFSINKSLLIENQHEDSLSAQRHVHDSIIYHGDILQIPITKAMITSVRSARGRYEHNLIKKRAMYEQEDDLKSKKRKIDSELKRIEKEKKDLTTEMQMMEEKMNVQIKTLEKYKETLN